MRFFKSLFREDIGTDFIPGTVTTDIREAYKWFKIYSSSKRERFTIKRNGTPKMIMFEFDEELCSHDEFQRSGICEHKRNNCWTSASKVKAQINTPVRNFEFVDFDKFISELV